MYVHVTLLKEPFCSAHISLFAKASENFSVQAYAVVLSKQNIVPINWLSLAKQIMSRSPILAPHCLLFCDK